MLTSKERMREIKIKVKKRISTTYYEDWINDDWSELLRVLTLNDIFLLFKLNINKDQVLYIATTTSY